VAHNDIRLILDKAAGRLDQVPKPVFVQPGDTVSWTSDTKELLVSFASDNNPFADGALFVGTGGLPTNVGTVRADVSRSTHFECTVTIDGTVFEHWSGVDVPGT
jgi:hypothetical protein